MKILVDGQLLILSEKPKIRLTLHSPLFADEQPGSYSNQFNVPICDQNAKVLGWTHLPGSRSDRRKDYPAEVQVGAFRFIGTLQCRESTLTDYKCNLIITPANVPAVLWKRKLRQFDFGTVEYQKLTVEALLYSATMPDLGGSQFRTTVQIKEGTKVIFGYTYPGISQSGTGDYLPRPFWADFASLFMEAVAKMSEDRDLPWSYYQARGYAGEDLRGFDAEGSDTGFSMITPRFGSFSVVVTSTVDGRGGTRPATIVLNQAQINFPLQTNAQGKNLMQMDERYCMPMLKNADWYGEENKAWNGYVNAVTQANTDSLGGYTLNVESPTRCSLAPAIYLRWAIHKTCEILGYRLNDQVFKDADLKRLALWVNRSLDEQVPSTERVFNQYQKTWKIADHLPDLTMKEWVNAFGQNLFFKPIFYPSRKECVIVFLKDILASTSAVNWTKKLVKTRELHTEDYKPIQVAFALDSGDGLAKTEDEKTKAEVPLYMPVPSDKVVDADQEKQYEKLELPFSPVLMEKRTVAVVSSDPDSPYYSRDWQQASQQIAVTPILKQPGVSPLFNQADTALSPGRLMFYVPDKKIPNPLAPPRGGDDFPPHRITTGDSETDTYSLQLGGEKGILKTFAGDWLRLLERPGYEKYRIVLNPIDLQQFRWEQKYHLNGLNYLVEVIDVTLEESGIFDPAEITVRKVL